MSTSAHPAGIAPSVMETTNVGSPRLVTSATNPPGFRAKVHNIRILSLEELLRHPFPQPAQILTPWLMTQSLTMIHAWRGVGKTHVALNIAVAVASGGTFLGWSAPTPRKVLYLDGEMPGSAMCARLRGILGEGAASAISSHLAIVTPDAQESAMPDLVTREGQEAIEGAAREADVIIVDNISTLCRATGPENDAESWRAPQEWALRMRRHGKSVLFVHHSGKGGGQRGSSKREDTLDVVIHLRKPDDYTPDQGARFEVHYEKFRHGFGNDARPFEARLVPGSGGGTRWEWDYLKEPADEEVLKLLAEGHTQEEVAKLVGKHKSTISRIAKKARADGKLRDNGASRKTETDGSSVAPPQGGSTV